ncbi:TAXI family TRAP transporter solute-binding subunit [Actinoplanes sp. NPDC020271]|uniref:TAXI family TRAP transporter solute-binding subunit n=1 Tax=Actinoplanes sp. NPDC020271 TaxID=3363896 RepID=UPI0037A6B85A
MIGRRSFLGATAAGVITLLTGCDEGEHPAGSLRIATGGHGGVYFRLGEGLARAIREQYPGLRPEVLVTNASVSNVALVNRGAAEVGFTQADVLTGAGPADPLALARLHDDYLHLVVRADSGLHALGDLRHQRVSLGAAGSGTEISARRLLDVAGLRPGTDLIDPGLGLDDAVSALATQAVDAFFFSGGLPVAAVAALAADVRIRLIGLRRYVPALRRRYGEVYAERNIPTGVYPTAPVVTVAVPNYLVAPPGLPEPTAYAVTRLLMEEPDLLRAAHPAADRFNRRNAIVTEPLALHPGAVRYYRESKP